MSRALRAITLSSLLLMLLLLCQCRTINKCLSFFRDHSSKGHSMQSGGVSTPTRALTVEEFIEANAHRNLDPELLRTRFRVADANRDGLLTPEEVESHRERVAEKKRNAARG